MSAPAFTTHLRPGEAVRWAARPSKWGIVPEALNAVGGLAGTAAGAWLAARFDPTQVAGYGVLLLAFLGFLARFVQAVTRILFTTFVATGDRFYAITSFFTTTVRSAPLARLTTVTVRQGPLQRAFGLWTARLTAYGEAGATFEVPAIRDGTGLLREGQEMMGRGANVRWLLRGD